MSADVINLSASSSSVKKGESLRDTALTLSSLGADSIIIRHPSSGAAQQVANWVAPNGNGPSVINAGDGSHQHPTQALLDAMTIRQRLGISMGNFAGMQVKIVGDCLHSRVVRSNVDLLTKLGAEVTLVAPPTLLPFGVETWPVKTSAISASKFTEVFTGQVSTPKGKSVGGATSLTSAPSAVRKSTLGLTTPDQRQADPNRDH